ncbi:MAG: hypothetical protein ACLPQS_13800 [Acidimicrobiales bacterium]
MSDGPLEHLGGFEEDLPEPQPTPAGASLDEPGPPKSAWETPRGWTDEEWAEKNFGTSIRRSPWTSLDIGKGWLLAVVFGGVLLIVLVLVLVLHSYF